MGGINYKWEKTRIKQEKLFLWYLEFIKINIFAIVKWMGLSTDKNLLSANGQNPNAHKIINLYS